MQDRRRRGIIVKFWLETQIEQVVSFDKSSGLHHATDGTTPPPPPHRAALVGR